jgi:hypothetical protein
MIGRVSVLFVRVSVVALPTNVSVLVGSVNVPVLLMLEIIGVVRVLLVRVSVVALPTNVSVLVGSVNVPVLLMLEIIGVVRVLLVKVSVPAKVANVPVVGNVTLVAPVSVRVYAKLPEPVTVIAALLDTPVPPFAGAKVPATETAPDVAVLGVKPVEPKLIVVTPSATLEATLTKSEPFHAQTAFSPVTNVTPAVGPVTPTSLTDWAVALITTYTLLVLGALIVNRLAGVPVQLITMY